MMSAARVKRIPKVKPRFNDENERIYCICEGIDDGSLMLQCDHCSQWFHAKCVGLVDENHDEDDDEIELPEVYACQSCTGILGAAGVLEHQHEKSLKRPMEASQKSSLEKKPKVAQPTKAEKIRRMAKKGFKETFETILPQLESSKEADDILVEGVSDPETFAEILERCLFNAHEKGGEPTEQYKSKFRTLQFNLKDSSNTRLRKRVFFTGPHHVSLQDLVNLSPEELANDKVLIEAEKARDAALKSAFKPQGDLAELARKAELEKLAKEAESAVTVDPSVSDITALSSSVSPLVDEKIKSENIVSSSSVDAAFSDAKADSAAVKTESTVVSEKKDFALAKPKPTVAPVVAKPIDSLDDLLAKIDSAQSSTPATSGAAAINLQDDLPYSSVPIITASQAINDDTQDDELPEGETIWQGNVKMPGEGNFSGSAIQVLGPFLDVNDWSGLIRKELFISGRIDITRSTKYLYERMSKKADILVIEVFPDDSDAASYTGFQKLVSYFSTKDRWCVVDHRKTVGVKDVYLCPVPAGQAIPSVFGDFIPHIALSPITKRDRFFGVFIIAPGHLESLKRKMTSLDPASDFLSSTGIVPPPQPLFTSSNVFPPPPTLLPHGFNQQGGYQSFQQQSFQQPQTFFPQQHQQQQIYHQAPPPPPQLYPNHNVLNQGNMMGNPLGLGSNVDVGNLLKDLISNLAHTQQQ